MNSRFNSRLQNRDEPKQGNVASYFDNLKNLVQVNDGTRSFVLKTVDCHDHSAPFDESQETRIAITHSDHHISQITDGFLTIRLQPTLQLLGIDQANFDDPYHLCKIVCASKSTNTLLWQNQILNRNLDVGYQQNECIRKGFAYSVIKPKQEKKTKIYSYTLRKRG